jgi:hypothetical protein
MAKYSVHVFCDGCGDVHPMGIAIELPDGPANRASIGDVYQGRDLPPQIAALINNRIVCPQTKRWVLQRNNNQVFLVPIS